MKAWQNKLINLVKPYMGKIGPEHSMDHSERVFKYCLIFSKGYKKVDLDSLFVAAYLHDLGYLKGKKDGVGHTKSILCDVANLLRRAGAPDSNLNLIKQIISLHGARDDLAKLKLPVEVFIFHDADKIDGSGTMGVARQLVYTGRIGRIIWDPKIKRSPSLPYGGNRSAVHVLLDYHLRHRFYTKEAKRIATTRKKYMREFVGQFIKEYNFKS